eukprot:s634_g27.t1
MLEMRFFKYHSGFDPDPQMGYSSRWLWQWHGVLVLKRCLAGQRAAASEWNTFFIQVCERFGFLNFQGTIFKHKEETAFISIHIDDRLVVGFLHTFGAWQSKACVNEICSGRNKQCVDSGSWWTGSQRRKILQISTQEHSRERERREFLMKRMGLVSENFESDDEVPYQGKKRQLVKMLVNMIMATNLRGCDLGLTTWTSSWSFDGQGEDSCRALQWRLNFALVVIPLLCALMRTFFKFVQKREEVSA